MAKAKTGPFMITEPIAVTNATTTTKIDLGAYVDPADKQGLMITAVDFIWQNDTTFLPPDFAADWEAKVEVHDAVLGGLVGANNYHLVASAGLTTSSQSAAAKTTDLWPDRFGRAKNEGRIVVNDELEIASLASAALANTEVIVRLTVKVVSLTQKDFMCLALQTVAN